MVLWIPPSFPATANTVVRRLVALLMLLAVAFSLGETVTGQLRDGEVHHESNAEASAHALAAHGEHGHEDGSSHGPEHQHGTAADHCTHQHGTLISPASPALTTSAADATAAFRETSAWLDRHVDPSFRPPRA